MLKRTSVSLALALAALSASAADYYVVVPSPGKAVQLATQLAEINVALNSYTLPEAIAASPYAGFDFKTVLAVTGDSAYDGSLVTWEVVSGSLPAGLTMNADGTLSGTPTVAGTSNFALRATYQTKTGQQAYQVVTLGLSVSMATATLPAAKVNAAYAAYDFKPRLSVAGDPNYSVSNVTFSATGVPAGMALSSVGVLSGTPTTKNTSGANFQVVASYKTKTGQQAYTLIVNGVQLLVTSISAGYDHTCAVTTTGGAMCWGSNGDGQLGNGTKTQSLVPVAVSGLTAGVASISAGNSLTCAVTTSGGAKCWGGNAFGGLGNNGFTASSIPVDVSGLTTGVASLSVGNYHGCAMTTGGAVKCWGYNNVGQLGDNTTTSSRIPVAVTGLSTGVTSISSGLAHSCAVVSGGAQCWGGNSNGELGNGLTTNSKVPGAVTGLTSGVAMVVIGNQSACAVTTTGGAKCWGSNAFGGLGNGNNTNSKVPVDVSGLTTGVASIAVGQYYGCAVTTGGAAKCWGFNTVGQLGNNSTTGTNAPVDVFGLAAGVTSLVAGDSQTCAVTTGGAAKCWGANTKGQLGDNSTTQRLTPVSVLN